MYTSTSKRKPLSLALCTAFSAAALTQAPQSLAAIITVNTNADVSPAAGACSLRMAIDNVNNQATTHSECSPIGAYGSDTIGFDLSIFPNYSRTAIIVTSELRLNTSTVTTIDAGFDSVAIDGGGVSRIFYTATRTNTVLKGLTIRNGSNNGKGAGIYNNGTLVMDNCTVSGNAAGHYGGGIYNSITGTLMVSNSTISGNSAAFGAGIASWGTTNVIPSGTAALVNTTISGNVATNRGGAFWIGYTANLELTSSTLSGNSAGTAGGEIYTSKSARTTLVNTIVANTVSGNNCSGLGTFVDHGSNIDDGTSCGFTVAANSFPNTTPKLGSLGNYGGLTATKMLLGGSPAIDAISCANVPSLDQRDINRPQGARCDIGAVERQAIEDTIFLDHFEGY